MTSAVEYAANRAGAAAVALHLRRCDGNFVPRLSQRVSVDDYAQKLTALAQRFEAWINDELVGLVAAYCNDPEGDAAYISSVSVLPAWHGLGIASHLVAQCIQHARQRGLGRVALEVDAGNLAAMHLYSKHGFAVDTTCGTAVTLRLTLEKGAGDETKA